MRTSKDTSHMPSQTVARTNASPPWHGVPTAVARRFHQICVAKTSEVVAEAGLTPLQYGVLIHLSKLTGTPGIEQNSLADRLNIDRNTVSVLVEQLVKKDLVDRRVNDADRRARLLSLTAKGEKTYARLRPAHLTANEGILAPITPRERRLLINLLIRVIEGNLAQDDRDPGGRDRRSD
jgi:DNA-binding MarR family transcriptional regulator